MSATTPIGLSPPNRTVGARRSKLHLNGGQPLRRDCMYGGFPLLATTVAAGTADEVTVDVIKNDPRTSDSPS